MKCEYTAKYLRADVAFSKLKQYAKETIYSGEH